MDFLGTVSRVFEVKWDLLFRIAASVLGVAALVGWSSADTPLQVLAQALDWSGLGIAAHGVDVAHAWVSDRADVVTVVGWGTMGFGVISTTWDGRGAAAAILGIAALAEVGVEIFPATLAVLGAAVVIAFAISRLVHGPAGDAFSSASAWLASCCAQMFGATLFVLAMPISWIAGRPPRRLGW
jgi:hypothetical protein